MRYDVRHLYHIYKSENLYFWMLLPLIEVDYYFKWYFANILFFANLSTQYFLHTEAEPGQKCISLDFEPTLVLIKLLFSWKMTLLNL